VFGALAQVLLEVAKGLAENSLQILHTPPTQAEKTKDVT